MSNKMSHQENQSDISVTNNNTQFDISCIIVLVISLISVIFNSLTVCAFLYAKKKERNLIFIRLGENLPYLFGT